MYIYLLGFIALILFIILIGKIENNDMKEINDAFMKTNWSDPFQSLEYLNLVATKPQWRIAFISGSLVAFAITGIVINILNKSEVPMNKLILNPFIIYLIITSFLFIAMTGYLSFFTFHTMLPNGGQDIFLKLKYYDCKNVTTKYGSKKK